MALCIEPILTHRELVATLVATIPECTLTPGEPEKQNTLRASIVNGRLTASLVSGRVDATVVNGSLRHASVSAELRRNGLQASLTSQAGLKATLTGNQPVKGTLTSKAYGDFSLTAGIVDASLEGRFTDAYLAVYCPINYVVSCFSLGGWDDELGWDDDKGWKN